ncbi:hypothetical protein EBU94_08010 [bacterium]|nr:hypothetical protein [bacterium]
MQYIIFFGGGLLGLILTVLVQAELINRSQKFEAGFNDALKFYTKQNRGGIYIGITVLLCCLFVLPNILNSDINAFEKFAERIRFWSIGIGIGSQAIGFLAVKRTHSELKKLNND